MSRLCTPKLARAALGFVPALVGVLLIAGCGGDGYPEDLAYPLRTDPLVLTRGGQEAPDKQPTGYERPGELYTRFDNPEHPLLTKTINEDEGPRYAVVFPENDPRLKGSTLKETDRDRLEKAMDVLADNQDRLKAALDDLFGSPREPKVGAITKEVRQTLKLEASREDGARGLVNGSKLYRLHCVHCHGLTGDGRGPTAPWVNPHPRDYRQGVFKFTSTRQPESVRKPRRVDLLRTLREGIEGTSMPSFKLLPAADLEDLASYVIHLSLRGQAELRLMEMYLVQTYLNRNYRLKNLKQTLTQEVRKLAQLWVEANDDSNRIQPTAPKVALHTEKDEDKLRASLQKGQTLFRTAGCLGCHVDYGRQSAFNYDAWGTIVRPVNLTAGVYRGGRRPLDLFYRISGGISGVRMPGYAEEKTPAERDQEIWDVVNFLQVVPYSAMRKKYGVDIDDQPAKE